VLHLCYTNEHLNPWHILAETANGRHVIMTHYGNGDIPNAQPIIYTAYTAVRHTAVLAAWE